MGFSGGPNFMRDRRTYRTISDCASVVNITAERRSSEQILTYHRFGKPETPVEKTKE
jgi:hypothetical protein